MCKKLREDEGVFSHLRQFAVLLTNNQAAASEILLEVRRSRAIDLALSNSDRKTRMALYEATFNIIERLLREPDKLLPASDSESVCNAPHLPAAASKLLAEFQRLPLGAKAAMALVVIERWSVDETATIMDTTPQQVREKLLEARRTLSADLWRKDYLAE